jgi:hypothetical protein
MKSSDPSRKETTKSPIDRRRFIHVMAASGAAILAGSLPRARAATRKAAAPRTATGIPAAVEREIRNQEKSIADTLKIIRAYELPPGSEPATVFRAMRARRGGR